MEETQINTYWYEEHTFSLVVADLLSTCGNTVNNDVTDCLCKRRNISILLMGTHSSSP